MSSQGSSHGQFEISRVLSRMFEVIGSNPVTFFGLALMLSIPSVAIDLWRTMVGGTRGAPNPQLIQAVASPGGIVTVIVGAFVAIIIFMVFANLLSAALTHTTIVALNGRKASIGESFMTGIRHAVPLTVIALLAAIGIMLGFILLIVPGVLLALMWTVLAPVRVAERTPIMETFSRSAELTKGYRGQIFLMVLIYVVALIVIEMLALPLVGLSAMAGQAGGFSIVFLVVQVVQTTVTSLLSSTGVASIYYELRTVKEGAGPEQLAAVFS